MDIIFPPQFQAGFSPILLTYKGNIGDNVQIVISPDNEQIVESRDKIPDFSISAVLIKKEQTFNLAAYVQSLFKSADTQTISYRIMVNGVSAEHKFYALRSAVQVGESADMATRLGSFLTDMKQLDVWQGYPEREVSVLAEDGYNAQLTGGGDLQNISLPGGLSNITVSFGDAKLEVYTNAATWDEYYCQLVEVAYPFTVHVGDRTAKLSGTVSLTVSRVGSAPYTITKSYSGFQDVHFEIPTEESIIGIGITANGALDTNSVQIVAALQPYRECELPTVTRTLPVSHAIIAPNSGVSLNKNSSRLLNLTLNQPITE